jgi:cyclic pyranopterin phosphate synthase
MLKLYFKFLKNRDKTKIGEFLHSMLKGADDTWAHVDQILVEKKLKKVNPEVSIVHVSLLSNCNLRCQGCSYGRDFMPKEKLDFAVVKNMLRELNELGVPKVHFYGGEPLLHVDILKIIAYATELGIFSTLGTNASLLNEKRIKHLYEAGLRHIAIGVYGVGEDYDEYVSIAGSFEKLETNVKYARQQFPDLDITFSWLLKKPTCNLESLHEIYELSEKYQIPFDFSLIHYDFPYFTEGNEHELQFYEEDRDIINTFTKEALRLKQKTPHLISNSLEGIRSIPDWLILKSDMQVPCHRYHRLWIGPNGVVRVCQKNSDLGNIYDTSLKDMLYTDLHHEASQDCYELNCTNCHVGYDERIQMHPSSRKKYAL